MFIDTWGDVLTASFQNLWMGVVHYVPNLVIAIVILIVGWLIGALLGRAVAQVFRSLKVDSALRQGGFESFLRRGGINLDSGVFIGGLVKWFVILTFLVASFDVLGLDQVNFFLRDVLAYLPHVFVAAFVLLVAGVIADVLQRIIVASAKTAGVGSAHLAGSVAKWAVWIVAILAALSQLGIASTLSQTMFTGIVVAVALALGLSFGLGGQEAAARFIDRLRSDMSGRHSN